MYTFYAESPLVIATDRVFDVGWLKTVSQEKIILGSEVEVEMTVHSQLPSVIQ